MAMESDPQKLKEIIKNLGPQYLDNQIHQAIVFCWMSLPDEKKSIIELEQHFRARVDYVLMNFSKGVPPSA